VAEKACEAVCCEHASTWFCDECGAWLCEDCKSDWCAHHEYCKTGERMEDEAYS